MPGTNSDDTVIIVGAGPAGIFTAMELSRHAPQARLVVFDKGKDIHQRRCLRQEDGGPCRHCPRCAVLSGWGGAGAFSDGKLNLSTEIGGSLEKHLLPDESLAKLIEEVDRVYLDHGAPQKIYAMKDEDFLELARHFEKYNLRLIPSRIRHMGTELCQNALRSMRSSLASAADINFNREVKGLIVSKGQVQGVVDDRGQDHFARYVVVAPGRDGAEWLAEEANRLNLNKSHHPVDIGVRVEVPSAVLSELTGLLYETKVRFNSPTFDDPVRTFCMCPEGEVVQETGGGVTLVNGQSFSRKKTGRTNFAVLVSTNFTEPFREPIAYGKYIARLANILGGGIIVQRLGDLRAGRRSTADRISEGALTPSLTSATPGDLSFVLPYRLLMGIIEMIDSLGRAVPGLDSPETLLYGVEAKFYSLRMDLRPHLETAVKNLFVIGDGAGVSRGLVQASASGFVAAREIGRRFRGAKRCL